MRYTKEHKHATHDRIVRKASMRLREKGIYGVGVAELMKEAGLTHGGFYSHFQSREALMVEAVTYAMDRSMEQWRQLTLDMTPAQRLAAIADTYLSKQHRDDPARGCAVLAVGAEIAREAPKTRKAFAAKVAAMIDLLAAEIEGVPAKEARQQACAMLATMVGTLLLARISGAGEVSDEILAAGRDALPLASPRAAAPVARRGSRQAPSATSSSSKSSSSKSSSSKPSSSRPSVLKASSSKSAKAADGTTNLDGKAGRADKPAKAARPARRGGRSAMLLPQG